MTSPQVERASKSTRTEAEVRAKASATAHTPGVWNYGQESIDPEWWVVTLEGGLIVANVNAHHHQEANARLIAAAPDLLAAVKLCATVLSDCVLFPERDDENQAYAKAKDAIAKATGGQP